MSVRKLDKTKHHKIGTVANSADAQAKRLELDKLMVYPESYEIGVQFHWGKQRKVFELKLSAALELVKGILENTPDFSVAADDELRNIFMEKLASADREARAVVKAVAERNESLGG